MTAVPGEQSVPVAVGGPGLACRGHFGRLAHIGEGGVGVGQLFLGQRPELMRISYKSESNLDTLEGAERSGAVVAVPRVSVPLAPGHEVDGHGAGICLLDGFGDLGNIRHNRAIHLEIEC